MECEKAKAAYKPGAWNKVRIVGVGPLVRTYLNDVPVSELVDDGSRNGIIGLQVHGVGGNKTPMDIKWRNLRIMELDPDDTAAIIDADVDTVGLISPRGADVMLAPGMGLEQWQLRPKKVPWMSNYEGNKKVANAKMSAKLNGKWIHRNIEVKGATGSGDPETPSPRTLRLQGHQHLVKFRNVWVCDLDNPVKLKNYDPRKKKTNKR